MKRERRKFSADFKAKVAIEAIKERSTLLQISSKFKISPAQVSKWKHEFVERSSSVFEKEDSDQKESEKKERELYSKIGELQVQPGRRSGRLFKKSLGEMSVHQKRSLIIRSYPKLCVSKQCELLELPRSSYYFKARGENQLNQFIMNKIDVKFTECPFYGVERMTGYINYSDVL